MLENSVFNRVSEGEKEISALSYNFVIGLTLLWGFGINGLMVMNIEPQAIANINMWVFFIGYFASCFFGVYLFNSSKDPAVSFLGYNFVVVPFGLIVNLVVHQYNPNVVFEAMKICFLVTVVMMCLGSLFPKFFQNIVGMITIALLAVLAIELVQIIFFGIHHEWIDWVVALGFCGYIGYDWGRANAIPKTVDNAVDSAAALYMDIINLFLRILRILGRRK